MLQLFRGFLEFYASPRGADGPGRGLEHRCCSHERHESLGRRAQAGRKCWSDFDDSGGFPDCLQNQPELQSLVGGTYPVGQDALVRIGDAGYSGNLHLFGLGSRLCLGCCGF